MEDQYFIEAEWLEAVRDKPFFYPCSGNDWSDAITIFGNVCSEIWFCDIYNRTGPLIPQNNNLGLTFDSSYVEGNPLSPFITDRIPRYVEPSRRYDTYLRKDGSKCVIVRRRGFGQIALHDEFADTTLGVFMHRCDSPGNGGSNAYFFANKKYYYHKLSNLADLLARKMSDKGLIITDGSNSAKGHHIRKFWGMPVQEAYEKFAPHIFMRDKLIWRCVGYIDIDSRRNCLVWGVIKQHTTL